ncbi:hypothetical protein LZG04_29995 [Saccharothrix sp. S26]|uniref:hypothetical protein n=1 Tax=Saccharothrix sp. S26 TaxID=2907215 RepID=UPI001F1A10D7|nr:hypothetical protein [Saccharothrix sp. S26]MCE6999003.1 hypothetical protein [Saccharothrix sp. S26]
MRTFSWKSSAGRSSLHACQNAVSLRGPAILGEVGGGYLGGRLARQDRRTSLTVGVLVNTRGLTEIVVLQAGYSGGLLLDGGDGVRVEPGGIDLFAWRTWLDAPHGAPVDLGHPPAPSVEDVIRVWVGDRRDGPHVDVRRGASPATPRAAQRDLVDFLGPSRGWAGVHSPGQEELLVASVDAGPQITEPLPL